MPFFLGNTHCHDGTRRIEYQPSTGNEDDIPSSAWPTGRVGEEGGLTPTGANYRLQVQLFCDTPKGKYCGYHKDIIKSLYPVKMCQRYPESLRMEGDSVVPVLEYAKRVRENGLPDDRTSHKLARRDESKEGERQKESENRERQKESEERERRKESEIRERRDRKSVV